MALSCQNQIMMARSYTQCLPKIAQRIKDNEQFAIQSDGQHRTGGSNCEMFEMTWQVLTLKAVLHRKKGKLISAIELHCTN